MTGSTIEESSQELSLESLSIHPNKGKSLDENASTGTVATENSASQSSEEMMGASMDFDRHFLNGETIHKDYRGFEDSDNWEDSFAVDDGNPHQRVLPFKELPTVGEDEDEEDATERS